MSLTGNVAAKPASSFLKKGQRGAAPQVTETIGDGWRVSFKGGAVAADLDARRLTDATSDAVLKHTRKTIEDAVDPATGTKKTPLKARSANEPGRLGDRGWRTGFLADNFQRTAVRGSSTRARTLIEPPREREVFLRAEARRGIGYVTNEGDAAQVIEDAAADFARGAIRGAGGSGSTRGKTAEQAS